jgi:hypothetical protein
MPDLAQVGVDSADHGLGLVAELAGNGVRGNRGALVERLEAGGAVGVTECFRPNLALLEARVRGHTIEQLSRVADHLLIAHGEGKRSRPPR